MTTWILKMKNFGCYVDETIEIPQGKLVLISGKSGKGKTTILEAIMYAFFGSKIKHVVNYGAAENGSGCVVELQTEKGTIVRTSKPQTVKVYTTEETVGGKEDFCFEHDSAEEVITKRIACQTYNQFIASSYVKQNLNNSILSLAPAAQLLFIEKLAFSNNNHEIMKQKIKDRLGSLIQQRSQLEINVKSLEKNLEKYEKELSILTTNIELTPDVAKRIEKNREVQASLSLKIKNILSRIASISASKKSLEVKIASKQTLINQQRVLELKIEELKESFKKIEDLPSIELIEEAEIKSENLTPLVSNLREYEKWRTSFDTLETMKKAHYGEIEREMNEHLTSPNYLTPEKVTEYEKGRVLLKQFEDQSNLKKSAQAIVREIFNTLKTRQVKLGGKLSASQLCEFLESYKSQLISTKIYQCPGCLVNVSLSGENGTLKICSKNQLAEMNTNVSLEEITDMISNIKSVLPTLKQPTIKLNESVLLLGSSEKCNTELANSKQHQIQIDRCKNALNNKNLPPSFKTIINTEQRLRLAIPKGYQHDEKYNLLVLEKELATTLIFLEKVWKIQKERTAIEENLKKTTLKYNTISSELEDVNVEEIASSSLKFEEEITTLEAERWDLERELKEEVDFAVQHQEILKKNDLLTSTNEIKEELKILAKDKVKLDDQINGYIGLEESAKQAEVTSIESMISSINAHAKKYLEKFFHDDITIELKNQRETLKGDIKNQMSVYVNNKGFDALYDKLSGGERQRANIAFLFAVNDMIGGNILMLDECINNLDAEDNMDIIEFMRDELLCETKSIYVISHEAIQGLFDHVIEVN